MASSTNGGYKAQRESLPIFSFREKLISILQKENVVIFKGETACGKTTQIPQYIYEADLASDGMIAITQPRRVAAITIAQRVASEMGSEVGETVGYSIRFEDETSPQTKLKYMTDGMLLRESISDPMLAAYSWVLLDEAHERTLHTDVLFGVVKSAQAMRRNLNFPPLKIVAMSATIDQKKLSEFFDNAPVYELPGRNYTISVYNSDEETDDYVAAAVSTVFTIHKNEEEGDILVFMTGEEEIDMLVKETERLWKEQEVEGSLSLQAFPLYSALPSSQQTKALQRYPGTRKVIYSTNIAETSLTIEGIKYVVDTGKVKSKTFNSSCGLDVLKVQNVSKAQAEQRTGRAGRHQTGNCYRLYTKEQFDKFEEFPCPEILRCSLLHVVLQLVAFGISDIQNFDFLDKPSEENISVAIDQLKLLGAIEEANDDLTLTDEGRRMVEFPLDPKLSKVVVSSGKFKCTDEVLSIIAMLSVEPLFSYGNEKELFDKLRIKFGNGEGDHIMLLNIYKGFNGASQRKNWCSQHQVNYRSMVKATFVRKQLSQICSRIGIKPCSCGPDTSLVRHCLVTGLFLNAAHQYKNRVFKTIGRKLKVQIHPSSTLFQVLPACCVYTDLVETSKCYMRNVSVVDEEWLLEIAPEYFKSCNFNRFELMSI